MNSDIKRKNPYALSFGIIPKQYINRDVIIEEVVDSLNSSIPSEQAYKITGIRGAGKTVTLTAIEREIRQDDRWIVVGVKSSADITPKIVQELYSSVSFITTFINTELNLSAFGIGINLSQKSPVASIDYSLKCILQEIKRRGKRVLVTIDEVRKTDAIIDFIQEFQILIREELPIYLIVSGLYEDVSSLENTDGLTFFYRATKIDMTPLNMGIIREDYKKTLGVSHDVADEMSILTKGYAFAYQALGKYMWDLKEKEVTEEVLVRLDDVLAEKVYRKVWSELAPKDKRYLQFIAQKDTMSASELLEVTKSKHNEWSEPRHRLKEKGIIDAPARGVVRMKLPRFKQFLENEVF